MKKVATTTLSPRSTRKAALRLPGEYSTDSRPPIYNLKIHATVRDSVEYTTRQLGDENHYIVVFDIENRNDSPAFVDLFIED